MLRHSENTLPLRIVHSVKVCFLCPEHIIKINDQNKMKGRGIKTFVRTISLLFPKTPNILDFIHMGGVGWLASLDIINIYTYT